MQDNILCYKMLSPALVIKNFVLGEKDCNYEKYLRELLNESKFFCNRSCGYKYVAPKNESHGESDCSFENHRFDLDFKIFESQTSLNALSTLSQQIMLTSYGGICTFASKTRIKNNYELDSDGLPKTYSKTTTRIHAVFKTLSFDELCKWAALSKDDCKNKDFITKDIIQILKKLEVQKNLLLFYPYEFYFNNCESFNTGISIIQTALNEYFHTAFQYRASVARDFETYFSFIYNESIVFFEMKNYSLRYVDHVDIHRSPIFMRLLKYSIPY